MVDQHELPLRRVIRTWWPLAASWLLMSIELPGISAIIARLAEPEINLAAYGGVVFPLVLIIEAPIIMLLAASTALSKDWASYEKIRRFMMRSGFVLTILHLLIALTPLYYVVVEGMIGAPAEIVEPARIGLIIMTPWTWSIAYRRFNQGVLIRFDHSRAVGIGTMIRLGANWIVLAIGYMLGDIPGIVVGTSAVATGVVAEAIYIGLRVRPVLRDELREAPAVEPALTFNVFIVFYVPLVLTSLLTMLGQPIGSAALSRMPSALDSLAAWPVVSGLVFMMRSMGVAYNEVVVALLDEPRAVRTLKRFAVGLSIATTGLLLLIAATPLSGIWFEDISALPARLSTLAQQAIWLALPLPTLAVLQSLYQGALLNSRKTRSITEAIVIYLSTFTAVQVLGVITGRFAGLYVTISAMGIAMFLQTIWLWVRSRPAFRDLTARDEALSAAPTIAYSEVA